MTSELGDELLKRKDINSALVCYIMAQNLEKVAELWKQRTLTFIKKNPTRKNELLFNYLEKITYFRIVAKKTDKNEQIEDMLSEILEYFANEGEKARAMKYLNMHGYQGKKLSKLAFKIYYSEERSVFGANIKPPQMPYQIAKIKQTIQKKV